MESREFDGDGRTATTVSPFRTSYEMKWWSSLRLISDFENDRIAVLDYNSTTIATLTYVTEPLALSLPRRDLLLITRARSILLYNLTDGNRRLIISDDSKSTLQDVSQAFFDMDGNLIVTVANRVWSYPVYRECPQSKSSGDGETVPIIWFVSLWIEGSSVFTPLNLCPAGRLGTGCTFIDDVCNVSQPCKSGGHCTTDATLQRGYTCSCPWGFNGDDCEIDQRPCKPDTCRNQGGKTSSSSYNRNHRL